MISAENPQTEPRAQRRPACADDAHHWSQRSPAWSPIFIPICTLCGLIDGPEIRDQIAKLHDEKIGALAGLLAERELDIATAYGNHRKGMHAQPHTPDLNFCLVCMVEFAEHGQPDHVAELRRLRAEKNWLLKSISPALLAEFRLCAQTSEQARAEDPNYPAMLKDLHGHMFTADGLVLSHPDCAECGGTVPPVDQLKQDLDDATDSALSYAQILADRTAERDRLRADVERLESQVADAEGDLRNTEQALAEARSEIEVLKAQRSDVVVTDLDELIQKTAEADPEFKAAAERAVLAGRCDVSWSMIGDGYRQCVRTKGHDGQHRDKTGGWMDPDCGSVGTLSGLFLGVALAAVAGVFLVMGVLEVLQ